MNNKFNNTRNSEKTDYKKEYIRINRNKRYTYKYYFFWDHDEDINTEHVKDPSKSEYVIIRGGKRSVFYEDINRREQIPNDKK